MEDNMKRMMSVLAIFFCLSQGCQKSEPDQTDFRLISISPGARTTNVSRDAIMSAKFSRDVDIFSARQEKAVILVDQAQTILVSTIMVDGNIIYITPATPFSENATYAVVFTSKLTDKKGITLNNPGGAEFSTGDTIASVPNWLAFCK
jgi:hypothetical protein